MWHALRSETRAQKRLHTRTRVDQSVPNSTCRTESIIYMMVLEDSFARSAHGDGRFSEGCTIDFWRVPAIVGTVLKAHGPVENPFVFEKHIVTLSHFSLRSFSRMFTGLLPGWANAMGSWHIFGMERRSLGRVQWSQIADRGCLEIRAR